MVSPPFEPANTRALDLWNWISSATLLNACRCKEEEASHTKRKRNRVLKSQPLETHWLQARLQVPALQSFLVLFCYYLPFHWLFQFQEQTFHHFSFWYAGSTVYHCRKHTLCKGFVGFDCCPEPRMNPPATQIEQFCSSSGELCATKGSHIRFLHGTISWFILVYEHKWTQAIPHKSIWTQMSSYIPNWVHMFPDGPVCSQMNLYIPRWAHIFPDEPVWTQISSGQTMQGWMSRLETCLVLMCVVGYLLHLSKY